MASMYETIMELPLFKGIGNDQVSLFLEKTKVDFLNFEAGDVLAEPGERVDSLDFILGGRVEVIHEIPGLGIKVREESGKGRVIGAMNLFGMTTRHMSEVRALDKVGIMRIGKEQYFNLLMTDKIYVLNLLNYLSAGAQKVESVIMETEGNSIDIKLKSLIESLTQKNSGPVAVEGTDEALAALCGVREQDFTRWKRERRDNGEIILEGEQIIFSKRP